MPRPYGKLTGRMAWRNKRSLQSSEVAGCKWNLGSEARSFQADLPGVQTATSIQEIGTQAGRSTPKELLRTSEPALIPGAFCSHLSVELTALRSGRNSCHPCCTSGSCLLRTDSEQQRQRLLDSSLHGRRTGVLCKVGGKASEQLIAAQGSWVSLSQGCWN